MKDIRLPLHCGAGKQRLAGDGTVHFPYMDLGFLVVWRKDLQTFCCVQARSPKIHSSFNDLVVKP